jgi:hypothetical protein
LLRRSKFDFKVIPVDDQPHGALRGLRSHLNQKRPQFIGAGFQCRLVGVAVDDDRLIKHQPAPAPIIAPHSAALRKRRCSAELPAQEFQRGRQLSLLFDGPLIAVLARNEQHQQRRFAFVRLQRPLAFGHAAFHVAGIAEHDSKLLGHKVKADSYGRMRRARRKLDVTAKSVIEAIEHFAGPPTFRRRRSIRRGGRQRRQLRNRPPRADAESLPRATSRGNRRRFLVIGPARG